MLSDNRGIFNINLPIFFLEKIGNRSILANAVVNVILEVSTSKLEVLYEKGRSWHILETYSMLYEDLNSTQNDDGTS